MGAMQAFLEDAPEFAVRRLTYYDPHERLTLVALAFQDGAERIVGVADVVFRSDGNDEIVVRSRDDIRRHGLETLLREAVFYTRLSLARAGAALPERPGGRAAPRPSRS